MNLSSQGEVPNPIGKHLAHYGMTREQERGREVPGRQYLRSRGSGCATST